MSTAFLIVQTSKCIKQTCAESASKRCPIGRATLTADQRHRLIDTFRGWRTLFQSHTLSKRSPVEVARFRGWIFALLQSFRNLSFVNACHIPASVQHNAVDVTDAPSRGCATRCHICRPFASSRHLWVALKPCPKLIGRLLLDDGCGVDSDGLWALRSRLWF